MLFVFARQYTDPGVRPRDLPKRNQRLRIVLAQVIPHVVEDAHNLPLDRRPELLHAGNQLLDHNALLQRIGPLQIFPDKLFVDHRDLHAGREVLFSKCAAIHQPDAEGLEVVRRHHAEAGARPL
jgi:hypothetical protein